MAETLPFGEWPGLNVGDPAGDVRRFGNRCETSTPFGSAPIWASSRATRDVAASFPSNQVRLVGCRTATPGNRSGPSARADLFEHVHLRPEGNYELAAVVQANPSSARWAILPAPPHGFPSRTAWTGWGGTVCRDQTVEPGPHASQRPLLPPARASAAIRGSIFDDRLPTQTRDARTLG